VTVERLAAVLILASQAVLLTLAFDTTGAHAILFSFVGHPLLAAGLGLAVWSGWRRRQEAVANEGRPRQSGARPGPPAADV